MNSERTSIQRVPSQIEDITKRGVTEGLHRVDELKKASCLTSGGKDPITRTS
jgi:hypothetical protein